MMAAIGALVMSIAPGLDVPLELAFDVRLDLLRLMHWRLIVVLQPRHQNIMGLCMSLGSAVVKLIAVGSTTLNSN